MEGIGDETVNKLNIVQSLMELIFQLKSLTVNQQSAMRYDRNTTGEVLNVIRAPIKSLVSPYIKVKYK